ncbi:MAG: hypothetical protein AAFR61_01340 [Bacteroidota bacterium]
MIPENLSPEVLDWLLARPFAELSAAEQARATAEISEEQYESLRQLMGASQESLQSLPPTLTARPDIKIKLKERMTAASQDTRKRWMKRISYPIAAAVAGLAMLVVIDSQSQLGLHPEGDGFGSMADSAHFDTAFDRMQIPRFDSAESTEDLGTR